RRDPGGPRAGPGLHPPPATDLRALPLHLSALHLGVAAPGGAPLVDTPPLPSIGACRARRARRSDAEGTTDDEGGRRVGRAPAGGGCGRRRDAAALRRW